MIEYARRILKRRSYYRAVFDGEVEASESVLADLRRFCRAGEAPLMIGRDGQTDVYATGMIAGRQEVYWRIMAHLHMDDSKLLKLKENIDND